MESSGIASSREWEAEAAQSAILLNLDEGYTPSLELEAIEAAGVSVRLCGSFGEARRLLAREGMTIGVLNASGEAPLLPSEVESLFAVAPTLRLIALTDKAFAGSPALAQLARHGLIYDFHTRPVRLQQLTFMIGHLRGLQELAQAAVARSAAAAEPHMVGSSPAMAEVFRSIRKVAAADAAVLITGESGTGKELAARAIHERSRRAGGPFVAVNCAALPATLIQSELFGHEKGAFTGARWAKTGHIETASGGTIFLDEIGDLPSDLQVNLLRFLQEKTIRRVGGTREVPVDVRVIAATHVDLEKAVAEGRFREDLYFRLNVLRFELPPLRERVEDIEVLAKFYLDRFMREGGHRAMGFSAEALRAMNGYEWPGNVRELINRIRRATVMCESRLIGPADLGFKQMPAPAQLLTLEEARTAAEREAIELALRLARQNLSEAARRLGTSRPTLYRLMERHGLTA